MVNFLNPYFIFPFLGLLPSFIWLIIFLKEDLHSEPKKMIVFAFISGLLISGFALLSQFSFQKFFYFLSENNLIVIFMLALFEEIFKFLGAYLVTYKNREFNEPVDAMIYLVVAALGFATVENLFIATATKDLSEIVNVLSVRFTGATLLHALASAILGYYWALTILNKNKKYFFKGLLIAAFIHGFFNFLIIRFFYHQYIFVYTSILILAAVFFVLIDFEKLRKIPNML